MKKFCALTLLAAASLTAKPYNTPYDLPENQTPTPSSLMLDQDDTTDSLAIPFDSSDVEDEIQIDNLYKRQEQMQNSSKKAPAQPK